MMWPLTIFTITSLLPLGLGAAVKPGVTPRHRDLDVPPNLLAKRAVCGEGP